MRRIFAQLVAVVSLLGLAGAGGADEGMWTFNHFPKQLVKQRYHFDVSDAWLDHVRLASVRFNSGGSGSFVSDRGLVMTNHHVGADCISKLGATDRDYHKNGFSAKTSADEIKCPDLELNVVVGIDDVTDQVKSVEKPGMDDSAINKAQKEKMAEIEKACADRTHGRCDVVTLYQGGIFNLYRYQKYTDVRLVFSPEFQIAFFGGDPDNFTYPRYDLDVAFFRVYEDGRPVHPENYLKWSASGAKDGELVFVSGNPGASARLDTIAQLEFLRDVSYPFVLKNLQRRRQLLQGYSSRGEEPARQAATPLFGVENNIKRFIGYRGGLLDPKLMDKKRREEEALKRKVVTTPEKEKTYGGIWKAIAASQKDYAGFYKRYTLSENNSFDSRLFNIARTLVRLTEEKTKPSEKRLREFRESNLPSIELALFSAAPIYDGLEQAQLASALEWMRAELGDSDPLVKTALAGKTPSERARELVAGTKLKDLAQRKQLAGSKSAVETASDPMVALARALDPEARALRKRYEDEIEAVVKKNLGLLGRFQFQEEGFAHYPDATFTLRLSYGKVASYTENGKHIAPMTTLAGLYQRSAQAGGKAPWNLPPRWEQAKAKLRLATPMDLVSTNDIIGGNSGSPVVNRAGELVGLIFDGNIQSLAGNFIYDDTQNRAVSVHSAAMVEALRHVYDSAALAEELQPTQPSGRKHAER